MEGQETLRPRKEMYLLKGRNWQMLVRTGPEIQVVWVGSDNMGNHKSLESSGVWQFLESNGCNQLQLILPFPGVGSLAMTYQYP